MRAIETAALLIRRFAADRRGNYLILTGVAMAALTGAVGLAVDVSQSYHLKSSLRAALDAAVTSTAYDITTGRIAPEAARASVEKFLGVNGRAAFSTQGAYRLETLTVDRGRRTIEATAFANVDLAFPFFGLKEPRVSITSAAVYSDKQIEVAMMLDVTGSMARTRSTDKIGDLKKAARNAVETMLRGQDPNKPRIRVALVPYASGVNTGGLADLVFAEQSGASNLPPAASDPLLVSATGSRELPAFATYLDIVGSASSRPDACATERKGNDGNADFSDDGPDTRRSDRNGKAYYALVNRDDQMTGTGMNKCPAAKVIPLTADSEALLASIDDFQANGYTAGAIAIQWTYYMLSPKWRAAIDMARLGDGPANHDPRKVRKVAILMTDGQFNTAYAGVKGSYNAQGDKARKNAEALCKAMRGPYEDRIEVFTIGFDLNNKDMSATEREQAKQVLKSCASPDKSGVRHYFEVSTGAELDAAFQEIIGNTEKVALTK